MDSVEHRRITKRDFIFRIARQSGYPIRVAAEIYEAMLTELTSAVQDNEIIVLTGFGRFYKQDHKGHKVRFGKSDVEDYSVLKFSASRSINRRLENGTDDSPDAFAGTDPSRPDTYGMIEVGDEPQATRSRELEAVAS